MPVLFDGGINVPPEKVEDLRKTAKLVSFVHYRELYQSNPPGWEGDSTPDSVLKDLLEWHIKLLINRMRRAAAEVEHQSTFSAPSDFVE